MNIVGTLPAQGGSNIPLNTSISIEFDIDIDSNSIDSSSVTVSTEKKNLLSVKNGIVQPTDLFANDNFFQTEYDAILDCVISAAGKILTVTPKRNLTPDTKYNVYVSGTIAGTDESLLGTVKTFSFTTTSQDMSESLPVEKEYTSILGSYLDFTENSATSPEFYVDFTFPKADSFLVSSNDIDIVFNKDFAADNLSVIVIYKHKVLSDEYATKLILNTDYTVSNTSNKITITLSQNLDTDNSILEVIIPKTIKSLDNESMSEDYVFTFIKNLTPYYSSTKAARLMGGSTLSNVEDVNLALMINYYSAEADSMLKKNTNISNESKAILKNKYVLWSSIYATLINNGAHQLVDFVKKQLGDFSISSSNKTTIELYNRLIKEAEKQKEKIKSYLLAANSVGYFYKNNSRNPDIGRMWPRGATPGLNTRVDTGERILMSWDHIIEPLPYNAYNVS